MSLQFRGKVRSTDKSMGVNSILMIFKSLRVDELYLRVSLKREEVQRLILLRFGEVKRDQQWD